MPVKLIFGLGNPGESYTFTRHNIGYLSVHHLAATHNTAMVHRGCFCSYGTGTIADTDIILAKPLTYMNNSGQAVLALMHYFNAAPADILIIHDDMDIEFGRLKLKPSGGSAGHRGIMSTIKHLQTNVFTRLRVGIGSPPAESDPVDFVLQQFTAYEQNQIDLLLRMIESCVTVLLTDGIERSMNIFHATDITAFKTSN